MAKPLRIALIAAGSLAALVLVLAVAAAIVLQTAWFHEQVRKRIVAEVERATGGTVEIGAFRFDWRSLRAEVADFVIRGTEPAGSPPLARIRSIAVGLHIASVLGRQVDIALLEVTEPNVNVILFENGRTNIPEPKVKRTGSPVMETILDLAVKRFSVEKGTVRYADRRIPLDIQGENLQALFRYDPFSSRYQGDLSLRVVGIPMPVNTSVALSVEKQRLRILNARLLGDGAELLVSGVVEDFANPRGVLQFQTTLALEQFGPALKLPVVRRGTATVSGEASFQPDGVYRVAGEMEGSGLGFRTGDFQLNGVRAKARLEAVPDRILLTGLTLSALGGRFVGSATVSKLESFSVAGRAEGFRLQELFLFAKQTQQGWSGVLSGPVEIRGLFPNAQRKDLAWTAETKLGIVPAEGKIPLSGSIDARFDSAREFLDLGNSELAFGSSQAKFSGALGARDARMQVQFDSRDLEDLAPLLAPEPVPVRLENGAAHFEGYVSGPLSAPLVSGNATLTGFVFEKRKFDSLATDFSLEKSGLRIRNVRLRQGVNDLQVEGQVGLSNWKLERSAQLALSAKVRNAELKDIAVLAGQPNLPVRGTLAATAEISGTPAQPVLHASFTAAKGEAYDEPFERIRGEVAYADEVLTLKPGILELGASRVEGTARFQHAPGRYDAGELEFSVSSNQMAIETFRKAKELLPDLQGSVQIKAAGEATLRSEAEAGGGSRFLLTRIDGEANGQRLVFQKRPLGDALLAVNTSGSNINIKAESNFLESQIRGAGQWKLVRGYPGSAEVTFSPLSLPALRNWLDPESRFQLGGTAEGKLTLAGPAFEPAAWLASLQVDNLRLTPPPPEGVRISRRQLTLRNAGPVRLVLERSVVRVESAHLVGPSTDFSISGQVLLKDKNPLDLRVTGEIELGILEELDPDIMASGNAVLDTSIRGAIRQPLINGRAELQDAALNYVDLPNGLSKANGLILFDGNRATIQNFSGETGGGKVTLGGFVGFSGGEVIYRVEANASQVRVRYPEGVSTSADAALELTGTSRRSLLSGTVTILRTGFNPRTDFGSVLAKASEPVRTPAVRTGPLGNMQLDIKMETSPDISFQSALAQDIQAEASLRLRGTIYNPVVLGRVTITQGELNFFGTNYTVSQGTISFTNPVKIEPVLNIDVQTRVRGIDVTLTISGPANQLNVTHRSDPPLEFSEIVALLATGRAPISDPTLAARQTAQPQSFSQLGANAVLGTAIANPLSNRLQRFFGVSRLKIDPQLTGVEGNPQARLTLEQQISRDITFTYITNLTRSNPQIIRVEWALNKEYSLVALREENGLLGVDILYKKRF
ncbi:MAG: translocation/assembly module TamB domain-containing protein [Bryobacteraceae bacterium]